MKKILSVLLIFLLTACSSTGSNYVEEEKYIEPINIDHLYDTLSEELQAVFPKQNQEAYIYDDIGLDMPEYTVTDYYGNSVNLSDYKNTNLIIEVSASYCTHCAEQIANNDKIIENTGATVMQFFIEDDNEAIKSFFEENGVDIPSNITVIPANDDLYNYFAYETSIEMVPTFYFFKNGKLTYMNIGIMTYDDFSKIYDYVFGDKALTEEMLNVRDYDDVLNDLSVASKDKLALIDNSEELTVSVIGKSVDFSSMYEADDGAIYSIDDFSKYSGKQLAVFYIGNIHNNLEGEIELINEFKKEHPKLNILTILVDSKDISTSEEYEKLDIKLNTDVMSSSARIPRVFVDTTIAEYPAMLFIEDNTFTGGFYNLESLEKMGRAYETFLGDDSIALRANNSK